MATRTTLQIRLAHRNDIDTLVAFNAAMARETEAKELDLVTLRAGVEGVFADSRRGFYLVAEIAGNVVGGLMITYEWSDWRNGTWWWLQSVYVMPDYRRRGVFHALHHEVERLASMKSKVIGLRLYVEKQNCQAQRTYSAMGISELNYFVYGKKLISRG